MDESNDYKAFSDAFMDRLAERRRRVLLGMKLIDATKAQLEWELAGARALIEEYEAVLADVISHKMVADKLNDQLVDILKRAPELIRSRDASERAQQRYRDDPKQEAKRFVRECWDQWQSTADLYKSQAAFARDMMDKVGINVGGSLTSIDTITKKWIPEFRRDTHKG
ncbi:hypothetical protein [Paraburkholderia sediminicola]|uniref:hypothetical protein n=1 Tax=Paraburkholderia sediminicola TaxID=458836 RepID=UPI0038BDC05B